MSQTEAPMLDEGAAVEADFREAWRNDPKRDQRRIRPTSNRRPLRVACATFYGITPTRNHSTFWRPLDRLRVQTTHHPYGLRIRYRLRALEREIGSIEMLGPLRLGALAPMLLSKLAYYQKIMGKRYHPARDRRLIESFGRQLERRLTTSDATVVLSPGSPGSQPVAYLDCRQPIVIWTDATFAEMLEADSHFSHDRLADETVRDGLANERAALERCSLAVYTSDWAARSAIRHYGLDPAKVTVVPPGGNLERALPADQVEAVVASRSSDLCHLLFIATRWGPKGADLAVDLARALNRAGLPTKLTVVGASPDRAEPLPPCVEIVGKLRKTVPDELAAMERLLREAHFLILPTRYEGAPNVVCEAAAYAVPSLVTDVGGVASVVSGRNGALFPKSAGADAYCSYIQDQFSNYDRYKELARSSFNEYATRLNWDSASAALHRHMLRVVEGISQSAETPTAEAGSSANSAPRTFYRSLKSGTGD